MVSTEQICLLHAEALASFGATGSQNSTAALGGHTGAEAVAHGTLVLIGLIGTLHIYILLLGFKRATMKL